MDEEDFDYELARMEEAERIREAPPQPQRTVYRPVDPGLKARILRQVGQPYDESAISKGQEFYLNGWDNGEDDGEPLLAKPALDMFNPSRGGARRPDEVSNYWDAAFKGSWGSGYTRDGIKPMSMGGNELKSPATPKPDFTFPLQPKNIIWHEQEMPRKNNPPDPLPEGTVVTSNDAGSNIGRIEEAKNTPMQQTSSKL